jgi:hypothetical protein
VKGSIRIVGALGVGIVIVLGALYASTTGVIGEQGGSIIAATTHERDYIESQDSDGDGIKDWEENLQTKFIASINASTTPASQGEEIDSAPPTTLTGKFTEAFLQDYLEGKMNEEDFSDPSGFLENAVTAINQNSASIHHSRLEIPVVETTDITVREYGNALAEILRTHSISNENEAVILSKALEANDPVLLEALAPIKNVYTGTIEDALRMNVPDELADEHMNLLNVLEAIRTDIEAMQVAFTDPLYALARIRFYEKDTKDLFNAFQTIAQVLTQHTVTYAKEEPGAFFYLFES